ncbi:hypothetical protein G7046_g7577 [Stylonectria norvegica]|nr:hypothetical protein G7046_g7577 [Stylonectria norvegica]
MASATSFYDFKPLDKRGKEVPLSNYRGKVVLVVNTASKCGLTGQYAGLETLYKTLNGKKPDDDAKAPADSVKKPEEFVILGFPCNQFMGQEPGSAEEIQSFCQLNYGVTFPIMQKTEVNGDNVNPLYQWLKHEKPWYRVERIKWNFEKFLIGRDGKIVQRFSPWTAPEAIEKDILKELAKPAPAGENIEIAT